MRTHGDGELLPSEALAQLNPQSRQCSHCLTGLMACDSFDGDALTCLNCGRSSFCPSPQIVAEEPPAPTPIDPIRHHINPPKRTKPALWHGHARGQACHGRLEVWPESHWPGFALREADVFKTYMAWLCM